MYMQLSTIAMMAQFVFFYVVLSHQDLFSFVKLVSVHVPTYFLRLHLFQTSGIDIIFLFNIT